MHSLVLISKNNQTVRYLMKECTELNCRVLVYSSILDLYPEILSENPVVLLIDGKSIVFNELGVIKVLKDTFPDLKVLLFFGQEKRELAAKAMTFGADAYILEPFHLDEMTAFIRNACASALKDTEFSTKMRMKALSLFIQGLAPEINNRLTPIMGALQLLMNRDEPPISEEDRKEYYKCMLNESTLIAEAVTELENFAKPRRPKKNSVSIKDTLDEAIEETVKDGNIEIPVQHDFNMSTDKSALIDQRQIKTALGALIRFLSDNADPKKGRIMVAAGALGEHSLEVAVEGFETISLGMEVENAFVPLHMKRLVQFKHELGLASAYGLIRAHEGSIKVENTPRGSRFIVNIPLD